MAKRPKIGLALGAGGARGLAHIGVLQVLMEEEIPIDFIAGASIGSMIGAFYAAGVDMYMLGKLAAELPQSQWLELSVPRFGLVKGSKVTELIRLLTHNKSFDDLQIPFAVVATDLKKGEKVIIKEGSIADAVMASSSIPGIFEPFRKNGRMLVDGAVIEQVPIATAREMGADKVIAVFLRHSTEEPKINNFIDVFVQSIEILEREVLKCSLMDADILITPKVNHIGTLKFEKAKECIALGREAALEILPEIKKMIQK